MTNKFTKTVTVKSTSNTPVFWLFSQNNRNGWQKNLPQYLLVEALNMNQANAVAEEMGCDFSVDEDGYQWSKLSYVYDEPTLVPSLFGVTVEEFVSSTKYTYHPYVAAVVYLNGETVHYHLSSEDSSNVSYVKVR